jgi:preprotein translocase subunit SecA
MRLFGGENIKGFMSKVGMSDGEPIYHPWLNKSIEKAQTKVEERNFEIRKHLLEYDDVLNQQRKFIYEQRDAILEDTNLKERVNTATNDMVASYLDIYSETSRKDTSGALKELTETLKNKFNYILKTNAEEVKNIEVLEKRLCAELKEDIENKEGIIGHNYLNFFIRDQYLMMVDRKWLDHLESMEALREAVYLRSYAQKNPLTEYKVEGFQIFETMIDDIRQEIASRLHLIRIQLAEKTGENQTPPQRPVRSQATVQTASHSSMGSFGSSAFGSKNEAAASSAINSARSQGGSVTVIRNHPKVGRNDPCPCGSGKKYKHCHGSG